MTKVSVIIPTYNEEEVIADCLKSLAKQTHKDYEVIVVDDGSTDKTVQKVKQQITDHRPRITMLRQKHRGAGAARNKGAKRARGDILVFVDADMVFKEDFLERLVKPILEGKAIGTFSKEEYLKNKDNVWARCWNINRGLPEDKMLPDDYPDEQKVFRAIKKSAFEKAGGFDEQAGYTDDWTLAEKLGEKAVAAKGAKFFHKNPDNLREIFVQSRWMAKRRYKFGFIGSLYALLRVSLPISLLAGVYKTSLKGLPQFLVFKVVSDFGQFVGILEYYLLGKKGK